MNKQTMILPLNKNCIPYCDVCEKTFNGNEPIVSIAMVANAHDIAFNSSSSLLENKNTIRIKLYHSDCFSSISGDDWWKK